MVYIQYLHQYYLKNVHTNGVFTAQFSNNSEYIVSGGRDAQLRFQYIPNLNTHGLLINSNFTTELPAHIYTINSVIQNTKSQHIWLSASRDRNIKIWEVYPISTQKIKLLGVLTGIRDGGHVRSVNKLIPYDNAENFDFEFFSAGDDKKIFRWSVANSNGIN